MICLHCVYKNVFIEKMSVPWKEGSLQMGTVLTYLMLFFFFFFKDSQLPEYSCPCFKIQHRFLNQESPKWKWLEVISNKRFGLGPCKEFICLAWYMEKMWVNPYQKETWKKPQLLRKAEHFLYDHNSRCQQIIWVCFYCGRMFYFIQLFTESENLCL